MATHENDPAAGNPCLNWKAVWKMDVQQLTDAAQQLKVSPEGEKKEILDRIGTVMPLPTRAEVHNQLSVSALKVLAKRLGIEGVATLKRQSLIHVILERYGKAEKGKKVRKKREKGKNQNADQEVAATSLVSHIRQPVKRARRSSDQLVNSLQTHLESFDTVLEIIANSPRLVCHPRFNALFKLIDSLPPLDMLHRSYQNEATRSMVNNDSDRGPLSTLRESGWQSQLRYTVRDPKLLGIARLNHCTPLFSVSCRCGFISALQLIQEQLLNFRVEVRKKVEQEFVKHKPILYPVLVVTWVSRERVKVNQDVVRHSLRFKVADRNRWEVFVVLSDSLARKYWDTLQVGNIVRLHRFIVSVASGIPNRPGDINLYVSDLEIVESCKGIPWDCNSIQFYRTEVEFQSINDWGKICNKKFFTYLLSTVPKETRKEIAKSLADQGSEHSETNQVVVNDTQESENECSSGPSDQVNESNEPLAGGQATSRISIPSLTDLENTEETNIRIELGNTSNSEQVNHNLYSECIDNDEREEISMLYESAENSIVDESDDIIVLKQLPETMKPLVCSESNLPLPDTAFPIRCRGNLCSGVRGMHFSRCVTKLFDVMDQRHTESLIDSFPFDVPNPGRRKNDTERILRYYFFSTHVYNVTGKCKQVKLPLCVVSKIRSCYPINPNQAHVGHKSLNLGYID